MNKKGPWPKYIAHIQETPNSGVIEMSLDDNDITSCMLSILGYFKLDRQDKLHSVRLSKVIEGDLQLVHTYPATNGPVYKDNVTVLRVRPKQQRYKFRVVWYPKNRKPGAPPHVVETFSFDWNDAALAAVKLEGLKSVVEAQYIIVFTLKEGPEGKPVLNTAGTIGTQVNPVGTAMVPVTTAVVTPPPPAIVYEEKKYYAHPYKIVKEFNG